MLGLGWVLGSLPVAGGSYTVEPGDTLFAVAQRFGTTASELQVLNNLPDTTLRVGQQLRVPTADVENGLWPGFRIHRVVEGEDFASVAAHYGLRVEAIRRVNPELTGDTLLPGGQLKIPPQEGALVVLEEGQDLLTLAFAHGLAPRELVRANGLANLSDAVPGQRLFVPGVVSPAYPERDQRELVPATFREQHQAQQRQLLLRAVTLLPDYQPFAEDYAWPLASRGVISSRFGPRRLVVRGSTFHTGLDVAVAIGTPILASQTGVVSRAGWGGSYGYVVFVDHGEGRQTRYAHMSQIAVHVGERVQQGDQLGRVGNTGFSTGPHLHFEIRMGGYAVDPLDYVTRP